MAEGTYYLTHIDDKYRRFYAIKNSSGESSTTTSTNALQTNQTADKSDSQTVNRLINMKMQLLAAKQ